MMEPETSKKRLHSALEEPPTALGWKRTKHELESAQRASITHTKSTSIGMYYSGLNPRDEPRLCPLQPETPSHFAHPGPCSTQGSQIHLKNLENQVFASNGRSSPATIVTSGYKINTHSCLKQTPPIRRAPQDPIIQSWEDSSDEESRFMVKSENSSLKTSAPANNAMNPSSPETISDYRSDFDTESESESGDRSISTRPMSPPKGSHCSTIPMLENSALKTLLDSFLPTIRAANEILERERAEGRLASRNIEDVDGDNEQYIEMNLGLGVLEEKKTRDISWRLDGSESESESDSDSKDEILGERESGGESLSSSSSSSSSSNSSGGEDESEDESESESEDESDLASSTTSEFDSTNDDARPEQRCTHHTDQKTNFLRTKPHPKESIQVRKAQEETNHLARLMGQQRRRSDEPVKKPIIEILLND